MYFENKKKQCESGVFVIKLKVGNF